MAIFIIGLLIAFILKLKRLSECFLLNLKAYHELIRKKSLQKLRLLKFPKYRKRGKANYKRINF